jgi:hypothetical protein
MENINYDSVPEYKFFFCLYIFIGNWNEADQFFKPSNWIIIYDYKLGIKAVDM